MIHLSCTTTADLHSGGSTDTMRITNQGTTGMEHWAQFVNTQGAVQSQPMAYTLAPHESARSTIGSLLQQAGIKAFNPALLLQSVGSGRSMHQG